MVIAGNLPILWRSSSIADDLPISSLGTILKLCLKSFSFKWDSLWNGGVGEDRSVLFDWANFSLIEIMCVGAWLLVTAGEKSFVDLSCSMSESRYMMVFS